MEERHPEVVGLCGGQKVLWLRQHRDEVLAYIREHGEGAALFYYNTQTTTLNKLIGQPEPEVPTSFEVRRANGLAEESLAGVRELRAQVRELAEAYQNFVELVGERLAKQFFLPLLRSVMKADSLPPRPDSPLSLVEPERSGCRAVAEAEKLLEQTETEYRERVQVWVDVSYRYEEALDKEDYKLALALYHWLRENDLHLEKGEV